MQIDPPKDLLEHINKFGETDGSIVYHLEQSVAQLFNEWRIFLYFFRGPEERVETMNSASGLIANTLLCSLRDVVLMRVRALMDRERFRADENVSLKQLVSVAKNHSQINLDAEYEKAKKICQPITKHATKRLAHQDLKSFRDPTSVSIKVDEITAAVKGVGDFLVSFQANVRDVSYEVHPCMSVVDEQEFMEVLYLGNAEKQRRRNLLLTNLRNHLGEEEGIEKLPNWIFDSKFRTTPF